MKYRFFDLEILLEKEIAFLNENMIWKGKCGDQTLLTKSKNFFPKIHPPVY